MPNIKTGRVLANSKLSSGNIEGLLQKAVMEVLADAVPPIFFTQI